MKRHYETCRRYLGLKVAYRQVGKCMDTPVEFLLSIHPRMSPNEVDSDHFTRANVVWK